MMLKYIQMTHEGENQTTICFTTSYTLTEQTKAWNDSPSKAEMTHPKIWPKRRWQNDVTDTTQIL